MKKVLIFALLVAGCKSTLDLRVTKMNGEVQNVTVKARKSICIASYDDSVTRLIDHKERVLVDSATDYEVLKVRK